MINIRTAPSTLSLLLFVASSQGCDDASSASDPTIGATGKADGIAVVDQVSPDVTVLRAGAIQGLGGEGQPGFSEGECTPIDAFTMDCTAAFEARFDRPALHEILVSRSPSFFCRVLRVETVTRADAAANADGIGFYYRGPGNTGRFVSQADWVELDQVALADGTTAVVHEFIGLANCWTGSSSSSFAATYEFKPFIAFTGDDETVYRNWDATPGNYVVRAANPSFDRSGELL